MHKTVRSPDLSHITFSWFYKFEETPRSLTHPVLVVVEAPILFIRAILQFWKKTTVYSCLKEIRGFYSLKADPSFRLMVDHSPRRSSMKTLVPPAIEIEDTRATDSGILTCISPCTRGSPHRQLCFSSVGCLLFRSHHIVLSDGTTRSVFQCP
jgi:hypothetical protein